MFATKLFNDLKNINENLKMLLEFCIETDFFDVLTKIIKIYNQNKEIEKKNYINLTK